MLQRSQASVGWRRTAARSTEAEEDATPPEGAVPLPPLAADAAARWLSNCRGAQTREMRHQMGAGRQASDLLLKEAAKGWMAGRGEFQRPSIRYSIAIPGTVSILGCSIPTFHAHSLGTTCAHRTFKQPRPVAAHFALRHGLHTSIARLEHHSEREV